MQFLSDLYVRCAECEGKRFQPHVLKARLHEKSIHQVLELTVSEAIEFFARLGKQKIGDTPLPQSSQRSAQSQSHPEADDEAPGQGRSLYSDFQWSQRPRRSWAWLSAAGSAVEHLVRRRIAAAEASRTFVGRFRHAQSVHLRRANHGTAFRRCGDAAAIIPAPCGSRAFVVVIERNLEVI